MKRPAIQLYFGDLLKNPRVLRCSWGGRGVLIWTMSILHDSDEYGAVRWPLVEIAQAVGCPVTLIRELATKGVLKGSDTRVDPYRWAPSHAGKRGPEIVLVPEQDGPLWYSSRMVRDEYKRTNRGLGTRFGQPGKLPTTPPDTPPSGTPSRANGDGEGAPQGPPTRREGAGASASSSISTAVVTPTDNAHATPHSKVNGGHKNALENQHRGAWRRDPNLALAHAAALGIRARPGETVEQLVARCDAKEAEKPRAA